MDHLKPEPPNSQSAAVSKQALLGQFFTPPNVARLIASLVTPRGPVLEPAAGDGAILRALRERFGATPLAIVAVERDPAVALPGTHLANFFAWEPEATFATIVGNPPYVRGQWIDKTTRKLWRSLSDQFALPKLDARANLYLYFIAEGVRRLRPGGELIFITPRDWLKATAAVPLNRWLFAQGTITHLIELGDARIFADALPNCQIFRYVKNDFSRRTLVATVKGGDPIPDDAARLTWELRHFTECAGHLLFLSDHHPFRLNQIASVKVGAVSGADAIFANPRYANREFVYSATVRTGKTRRMFWPDLAAPAPWLLEHKARLINRRVRRFDESNWWHWGRSHPQTDAPRVYVNTKTRAPKPFFLHPCRDFEGSVLALFPHDTTVDLEALCAALNRVAWEALGFVCDGRYLFTQRSLENAPLPEWFAPFIPQAAQDL